MRKPPRSGTPEAIRQFLTGSDYEPPARMIADISPEMATQKWDGFPYSIAEQVAHALFWQKRWLGRIHNKPLERKRGKNGDWPRVPAEQWESVRADFLAGLADLERLAADPDALTRRLENGDTVDELALQIVLHNSYHLGQIALLRQLLGSWPPTGGDDVW